LPEPVPGLVLHYAYLWHDQHRRGLGEGTKDRPCVVVLALAQAEAEGETVVTVAPVTHSPPRWPAEAVENPAATKRRLGLDGERSWIMLTEVNRFRWPGPDPRPVPGQRHTRYDYGMLPPGLFRQVRQGILDWAANLQQDDQAIMPRKRSVHGHA
jgi:hypothetical protein